MINLVGPYIMTQIISPPKIRVTEYDRHCFVFVFKIKTSFRKWIIIDLAIVKNKIYGNFDGNVSDLCILFFENSITYTQLMDQHGSIYKLR